MALNNTKHFKGILQYKSTDSFVKEAGYIYFVREFVDGKETGNTEIYFGTRKYADVATTKLAELQSAISKNADSITAIQQTIGSWSEKFSGSISTIANAVVAVSATTENNKTAIETLNGSGDGSVAKTVADAKSQLLGDAAEGYNTLGKLEDKIQEVAKSVTDKNVSAEGDTYVNATASNNKVTVSATQSTKDSLALADSALQKANITTGNANGTISVKGQDVAVKGLGSAAYTDASAYDVNGAAAQALADAKVYTNDSIAALSGSTSGKSVDNLVTVTIDEAAGKITGVSVGVNDIAKNSDLTAHTGDTEIHITDAERTAWNQAKSDIDVFLSGNTVEALDTLKEIQDYISKDGEAADNLVKSIASAQTTADKAVATIGKIAENTTVAAELTRIEGIADAAQTAGEVSSAIDAKINALSGNGEDSDDNGLVTVKVESASGKVTSVFVSTKDIARKSNLTAHTGDTDIHVTTNDKVKWNAAETNAKEYASAYTESAIVKLDLANTYDAKGAAEDVQTNLETYSGATKTILDDIESRLTAITNDAVTSVASSGKTITVTDNNDGAVNVDVNTLAVSSAQANGYVALEKTTDGALYGVMYYGGDDAE